MFQGFRFLVCRVVDFSLLVPNYPSHHLFSLVTLIPLRNIFDRRRRVRAVKFGSW